MICSSTIEKLNVVKEEMFQQTTLWTVNQTAPSQTQDFTPDYKDLFFFFHLFISSVFSVCLSLCSSPVHLVSPHVLSIVSSLPQFCILCPVLTSLSGHCGSHSWFGLSSRGLFFMLLSVPVCFSKFVGLSACFFVK